MHLLLHGFGSVDLRKFGMMLGRRHRLTGNPVINCDGTGGPDGNLAEQKQPARPPPTLYYCRHQAGFTPTALVV
jgi:hypothetical protein